MSRATSSDETVRRRRSISPWDVGAGAVLGAVILTAFEPQILAGAWHLVLGGSIKAGRIDRSVLHAPVKSVQPYEFGMAPIGGFVLADRVNNWSRTPLRLSDSLSLVGWGVLWMALMAPPLAVCALTDSWPIVMVISISWMPFLVYQVGRFQHRR